jgi:hypothetical protein
MIGYLLRGLMGRSGLRKELTVHFARLPLGELVTAGRDFPITSRVDVQAGLDGWVADRPAAKLLGIHAAVNHETPTMAHLFTTGPFPVELGPLQYDEVDIGEDFPARCLKNGLWLARDGDLPFAVLLSPSIRYGQAAGIHVEIAVPKGDRGAAFSQEFLRQLELRVADGRTYRGKVLSLEQQYDYSGLGGAVKVHRLRTVLRDDVILPEKTLALLDRNVGGFLASRDQIRKLRFSTKKGLLFYGSPGTGKTHTIHYLSSQLPEHTILLITAEQVGLIGEYFRLARFLQPALMVVEDVDLIARERTQMHNPMQEALLNKLLDEMDGLREDADVMFILTTNRPEELEPALASRPGRIDQAIEFPLPDEIGRRKLVALYSRGLTVPDALLNEVVRRTHGVSAAFIKELMRRCAQFQMESGGDTILAQSAVDAAIEEMVFLGGTLNLKLLGGTASQFEALS